MHRILLQRLGISSNYCFFFMGEVFEPSVWLGGVKCTFRGLFSATSMLPDLRPV